MRKYFIILVAIIIAAILVGCNTNAIRSDSADIISTEKTHSKASAPPPADTTVSGNTQTAQYDSTLLELWAKKYSGMVIDLLSYNNDSEVISPNEINLLTKTLGDYVSTDCTLFQNLKGNIGAWNYYRGGSPLFSEDGYGYTFNYEVQSADGDVIIINTKEHLLATYDNETGDQTPIDETVECSYTLKLTDGEYLCIDANCDKLFNVIQQYGIPLIPDDSEGGDNSGSTSGEYALSGVSNANSQLIEYAETVVKFKPQYSAYDCDYVELDISRFASNLNNGEPLSFSAGLYWHNYQVTGCTSDLNAFVSSENGDMITITVRCEGSMFTQYNKAYDAVYLTYNKN